MWETDCAIEHPVLLLIWWPSSEACDRWGQSLDKPKSPFPPVLPYHSICLEYPGPLRLEMEALIFHLEFLIQPSTFFPLPFQACALARTSFPYWSLNKLDWQMPQDIGLFCQRYSLVMLRVFLPVMEQPPPPPPYWSCLSSIHLSPL